MEKFRKESFAAARERETEKHFSATIYRFSKNIYDDVCLMFISNAPVNT